MSKAILSASGIEALDNELSLNLPRYGMTLAGTCYHRGVLEKVARETGADTVILSPALAGDKVFVEIVYSLRMAGLRVVVLPGNPQMESTQKIVMEVIPFGVYDFIYDEVKVDEVIDRLLNPCSLGDVPAGIVKTAIDNEGLSSKIEKSFLDKGGITREKGLKDKLINVTKAMRTNERQYKKHYHSEDDMTKKIDNTEEKKPADKKIKNEEMQESISCHPVHPVRKRIGKPTAILGVGDSRIEDWVKKNFSDQMDIMSCLTDPEVIKQYVVDYFPDILILMRQGAIGGVPDTEKLAVWSVSRVPAVLYIVGELDNHGKYMMNQAMNVGVRHIISCEKGGYISGDEFFFVLTNIIREMNQIGQNEQQQKEVESLSDESRKTITSLFKGAGLIGKTIKETAGDVTDKARTKKPLTLKKVKPKINMTDGLSLEEEKTGEMINVNLKNPTSIVPGGILAIVSPWRPNLAGRLAAQAVRILSEVEGSEVVYVGASKSSTGALWLNVSDEELMMSDWRIPGSSFPITQENIKIYAVDPTKDLQVEGEVNLWGIVKQARKTATYTVMDFGGDMAAAEKAAHQGRAVLLPVLPGNDPVEYKISLLWLRNFTEGKQNVVTGIDLRGSPNGIPEKLRPKVVIRNNPANALSSVLKKNSDDEFIWN